MTRASNVHVHPAAFGRTEAPAEDQPVSVIRAPLSAPLASGSEIDGRLGEELQTMKRWIESVFFNIGADPILQRRYSGDLATLKRMADLAGEIGLVTAAADRIAAVDRLRNPELKARLQRKVISGLFEVKH